MAVFGLEWVRSEPLAFLNTAPSCFRDEFP